MKQLFNRSTKIIAFILVFTLLFAGFQKIFHYRWEGFYENYVQFEKFPDTDVVFMGTSELWYGAIPVVIYDTEGISSFNLGHTYKSAASFYYETKYILKKKQPKVLAMDVSCLYADVDPGEDEEIYRSRVYALPDKEIRRELLMETCRLDKKEALSFIFPLLRFHDMWASEEADFDPEYRYEEVEPDFKLGWFTYDELHSDSYAEEAVEAYPEMWMGEVEGAGLTIPEKNRSYYDKIFALCREKGVEPVVVIPPKYGAAWEMSGQWPHTKEYLDSLGVKYLNYNTYEQYQRLGIDWVDEFYDEWHLNYVGAAKWSPILASDLKELTGLSDRRGVDEAFDAQMKEWADKFYDRYVNE